MPDCLKHTVDIVPMDTLLTTMFRMEVTPNPRKPPSILCHCEVAFNNKSPAVQEKMRPQGLSKDTQVPVVGVGTHSDNVQNAEEAVHTVSRQNLFDHHLSAIL
jgi:hypothetical protein